MCCVEASLLKRASLGVWTQIISEVCSDYFMPLLKSTIIREVVYIVHESRLRKALYVFTLSFLFQKEMVHWPLRSQGKYLWSFLFDFYTVESYLICLRLKCRVETTLALTNKGRYVPHTGLSSEFLDQKFISNKYWKPFWGYILNTSQVVQTGLEITVGALKQLQSSWHHLVWHNLH